MAGNILDRASVHGSGRGSKKPHTDSMHRRVKQKDTPGKYQWSTTEGHAAVLVSNWERRSPVINTVTTTPMPGAETKGLISGGQAKPRP